MNEAPGGQALASGMWTAVSGAKAQARNLDVISNNLANADTPAFKKNVPTFKEYLTQHERIEDAKDIPRGPIKDKDLYPLDGRDQAYVIVDGTATQFEQGPLRVTQHQLDLALQGPGFFEVSTPDGIRYTRFGRLKLSGDGTLVTSQGHPILSRAPLGLANQNNPQAPAGIAARFINLRDQGPHFQINDKGEIYSKDNFLGQINIVEFEDTNELQKRGEHLYINFRLNNEVAAQETVVHQGVIETSNVNPIEEMTNLIKANRLFEHDLKALKTYNEIMQKEANEVGKL